MKYSIIIILMLVSALSLAQEDKSTTFKPPIPVELMVGNEHSLYKMIVTKPINHKIKFYNLLSCEVNHQDFEFSIIVNQTVLYYDFNENFSVGLGSSIKTFGGFKPLFSVLYSKFTESVGYIIQPSIELHKEGVKELFCMFEYTYQNKKELKPYFRIDALLNWKKNHDFSYTNLRLGFNKNGLMFGPALNTQYFGVAPNLQNNWGGFIRVMLP